MDTSFQPEAPPPQRRRSNAFHVDQNESIVTVNLTEGCASFDRNVSVFFEEAPSFEKQTCR